jgi:excisionase family DNA binding protein
MIEFKFEDAGEAPHAPILYSVDDVAQLTKLARRTIYRAIKDGELSAFCLRTQLRISDAALRSWMNASIVVPPNASAASSRAPALAPSARTHPSGRLRPLLEAQ